MYSMIPKRMYSPLRFFDDDFFTLSKPVTNQFKMDIKEKDEQYILTAELPGYEKNDIEIRVEKETVSITASRNEQIEEEKEGYVHKESFSGTATRQVYFPNIDEAKTEAKYENGILTINISKKDKAQNRTIEIQ